MTSLTIKLPNDLKQRLEAQARVRGRSRSAIVRDALEKSLAVSRKARGDKPSLLERLQDLAGKGDSGVSDLATNPKHLKGFGQWRE